MQRTAAERAAADRFWLTVIAIFSAVTVAAIVFVLTNTRPAAGELATSGGRTGSRLDVSALPAMNVAWNSAAAVCLVAAYAAIRRNAVGAHRALVLAALAASTLFLAGYLIYHGASGGSRPYAGPVPWLYYPILVSHVILAIVIIPLALVTLRRGWTRHPRHRPLARVTLPLWLYVSITGVLIYALLYGPGA